jgi:hypothetical protein
MLTAAAVAGAAACISTTETARADGTFIGAQVSVTQTRMWDLGGADPGLNWNLDTLPTAAEALDFTMCGDGTIDLGGVARSHPTATFDSWTTYLLTGAAGSSLKLTGATSPQITVGDTVQSTYGSNYFAGGADIETPLVLGTPSDTVIDFTGINGGVLKIGGTITGPAGLQLLSSSSLGEGDVYFADPNAGYAGPVTINSGTAARLLDAGRTGTGSMILNGGRLDILSSTGVAQDLSLQTIDSALGTVTADRDYSVAALPPPISITHKLGPIVVDNPTMLGGTTAASIAFTADNLFNYHSTGMFVLNTGAFAAASRTISVENGDLRLGYDGSTLQTGPNGLNRQLVTLSVDSYYDINFDGSGLPMSKVGGGVLSIDGDNQVSSKGAKTVFKGVLRFVTAKSYGTTTGVVGGPPVTVLLSGAGAPVSSGMGIGYPTGVPVNLATDGSIPGQSGAIDVDTPAADAAPLAEPIVSTGGFATALRVGSSNSSGSTLTGAITPYTDFGAGTSTYFLGGGGGSLTISSFFAAGPFGAPATSLEMGTTGTLLPGLVSLTGAIGYSGPTKIKAGTLGIPFFGILTPSSVTHLASYSTSLNFGSSYGGAPATSPFNGPGQLLLSHTFAYAYGPGGSFGLAGGLHLDGGAIGYDGSVFLPAVPGSYGATLSSTLYESAFLAAAPVPTSILHFGGEYSSGTITTGFPIADVVFPVALLKSGIGSTLDLTAGPLVNPYSGGTGIMGGTVMINASGELGTSAIAITDGGVLHVVPGGPPMVPFPQILKVNNGPQRRGSVVNVDPGIIASFAGGSAAAGGSLQATAEQSVLEKEGGGILDILPTFLFPGGDPSNTWGLKVDSGLLEFNQLPYATTTAATGEAVFAADFVGGGGVMHQMLPTFAIPAGVQYSPNYGFSGISTFAGTTGTLMIDDGAFFRVNGFNPSNYMGDLKVNMGAKSVFKISAGPAGTLDTSGTGSVSFFGGNVQFTPIGTTNLFPQDGAFSLHLNSLAGVNLLFSGCGASNLNGNLYFNDSGASTDVSIDGATVDNIPSVATATWTIQGTGLTSWNGTVHKSQTEAIPGSGGPFTTGTVVFNRCQGAPVEISSTGATLDIEFGEVDAGNTGDPFTDNSGGITTGTHIDVINNSISATGFNITAGSKAIGNLSGTGNTIVAAGALLSVANEVQNGLTINGKMIVRALSSATLAPGSINKVNVALTFGGGATWNLTNNELITHTAIGTVLSDIVGGEFFTTNPGGVLGYKDVGGGFTEVRFTLLGDSDLDGIVNIADLANLSGNFGATAGKFWIDGDFDYNQNVNVADLADLAGNFGASLASRGLGSEAAAQAASVGASGAVPEPATVAMTTTLIAPLLLGRRKRGRWRRGVA